MEDILYIYAKNNLAVVNIYIKEPVVTNIWRDEKTPVINFIAYTGGLLGLCMGFSLVSLFEILYYTVKSLPWKKWLGFERSPGSNRPLLEIQSSKKDSWDNFKYIMSPILRRSYLLTVWFYHVSRHDLNYCIKSQVPSAAG